ncbi:FadR family transcriptional regulator [Sphingomonas sp. LB-2]|uniref:FadR/GntR family transcriptional regulator n=1 Tax=Sphingomonas caeni TaxID=2984949 RepID=UPI00222EE09F|nr:FadR/GntR family transcriptional regulator [Sphingomonas caeni]MCW3849512.1 FadR family transcriptional regulator [Sphingomonas caeni]
MRSSRVAGHDEIVAILGSQILSGELPPGSRLPTEEEMLARFGASRVLMREITKTLVAKGLAVAKTRVGTRVSPPEQWSYFDPDVLAWRVRLGFDHQFLEQLVQMRRAVEPAAAALAAEQRTGAHLAEMRKALAAMSDAGSDRRAFSDADLDFHIAVAVASGNPLFRSIASVIETALEAYFALSTPLQIASMEAAVASHTRIADAIEQRDGEAAARAMLAVIDEGPDRVRRQLLGLTKPAEPSIDEAANPSVVTCS